MSVGNITAPQFGVMIADGVNLRDPTLDTAIGPVRDLQIDPVSEVMEDQNKRVVYVNDLASLKNVEKLVPDDVDSIMFNEGIVRWDGSRSIVVVTFSRNQTPTANITVPVNFPLATIVDPETGVAINFRTIETQTMFFASPDAYYNAETEKYELDVLAASVSTGEETSIGAYTIKTMRRPLSGFDEVYNRNRSSSGRGTETNREVADRYLLHVEGSNIGTPAGVKSYVLDNFNTVYDAYVVYGQDTFLTREQTDAGAVDVWAMTEAPVERTYTTGYPGVETLIEVDRQPLIRVLEVATTGGVTFVEGTDYEVIIGEGEYSYSNMAEDGIKFISGGSAPAALDDPVIITFEYNSMIETLASYFTQPRFYSMGMDKLFRAAQPKYLEIEANLKVNSGNPDSVLLTVKTAVTEYINGLKLGDDVEEFDIDRVVSQVQGVDNWTYITLAEQDGTGVSDIAVDPAEYARILSTDFVINLVT